MIKFASPKQLRAAGVIGINERNVSLISRLNSRRSIRIANDKVETKRLALETGIPTPGLFGTVSTCRQARYAADMLCDERGGVIKPAQGSQGKGVLILTERQDTGFLRSSGRFTSADDIEWHCNNVLSGMYSLGGRHDVALLEERVLFDDCFDHVSWKGVPDIRIIALKGVPIAAMLRLPTAMSDGKANLHKGGVGVGLVIATGRSRGAMHVGRQISHHPDTGASLADLVVPHWRDMLEMTAKCYEMSGLGYLGADIVLDREKGPLLLEMNARPGIGIQIANNQGLKDRIDDVLALETSGMDAAARVRLAVELSHAANGTVPTPEADIPTGEIGFAMPPEQAGVIAAINWENGADQKVISRAAA